jgi:hypothetical protein
MNAHNKFREQKMIQPHSERMRATDNDVAPRSQLGNESWKGKGAADVST